DTVSAIKNYLEAIDKNQSYYDAHIQLGLIYSTANNALAIDYFNNALNLDPQSIEALYALGLFYQQTGDAEKAMSTYNRLLIADPENVYGHYNLGYVNLVLLKEFEQAIIHFDMASQLKPDYFEAVYNKAYCYELLGDYQTARELYNAVLEIEINYARAIEGLNRIQGR
ncbi:MAG: tetratricopeptide repeat protein, partial [Bacteroidota bacterium]